MEHADVSANGFAAFGSEHPIRAFVSFSPFRLRDFQNYLAKVFPFRQQSISFGGALHW
jgi:hypothetical protein